MKNTITTSIVASLVLGGSAFAGTTSGKGVAVAEVAPTSPFSTSLTVGYASTYEYRGVEIGDNLFNADLTTTYTVNDKLSLYAGAWYGTLWDGDYDELDLTGGATYDLGPVTIGALYRYYMYDQDFDDNSEVGLLLSSKSMGGFVVSVASYYDFEFDGFYFEAGGAYSHQFNDMVGIKLSSGVSYQMDYTVNTDGFNHVFVQADMPIAIAKNVTFTPFIKGVFPIDVLDDAGADDLVLGGASLTVTF